MVQFRNFILDRSGLVYIVQFYRQIVSRDIRLAISIRILFVIVLYHIYVLYCRIFDFSYFTLFTNTQKCNFNRFLFSFIIIMSNIILYVARRTYKSYFFHQFLHELDQLTLSELLIKIDEMKNWCCNVIDKLCELPEAEIESGCNWNCHIWLTPIDDCFQFYHPVEDLINGLAGVRLIGCGTEDSSYRIHRDILHKATSPMEYQNYLLRFAHTCPLFQVIILTTDLPEQVGLFIERQAIQVCILYIFSIFILFFGIFIFFVFYFFTVFWIWKSFELSTHSFKHIRWRLDRIRSSEIKFLVGVDKHLRR